MLNISRRRGPACITKWHEDMGPKIELKEWMKDIPDDKKMNKLAIPGTHNTMSFTTASLANHWVWCQCFDLRFQLDMGVRFLDIRCRHTEGEMFIHHGKYDLASKVEDVMTICREYLDEFPSEAIFVSLQHEMQDKDKTEDWVQNFIDFMENNVLNGDKVWRECKIPTMEEVRGKICVIANYPCYPTKQLSWGENFKVENTWAPGGQDTKWEKVMEHFEGARAEDEDSDKWYLAFMSYSDNEFPCNTADRMNNQLLPWLRKNYGQFPNGAGFIVLDYPGFEMCSAIIGLSSSEPWKCPVGWEQPTNLILLPAVAQNTPHGEVPGKTLPGGKQCWYGYDGKECSTTDFKVVGGDVKPIALALDGTEVQMGIAQTRFGYTPCKTNGNECWYTHDGQEYKQKSNFAVLEYPGA